MAGVDIFSLGAGGLSAARNALDVTSNNIANVNTEGYSRQRAEFESLTPVLFGGNFFGAGVETSDINRIFDKIANLELINSRSSFSEQQVFFDLSSRVDSLLSDPSAGISPAIQSFFESLQSLSTDPSSLTQREVVFNQLKTLSNRFNTLDKQLTDIGKTAEAELGVIAEEVNTIGKNIGLLNQEISKAKGVGVGEPNDLLDKRDLLVSRLSELVGVTTLEQDNGALNVFIGNGQGLVVGSSVAKLITQPNPELPQQQDLLIDNGSSQVVVTNLISGGRLGGLLNFRDGLLTNAVNRLGKIALSVSETVNQQNNLGMDLNDVLGTDLFADINSTQQQLSRISVNSNNAGNLDLQVRIDDTNLLSDDEYRLRYDAATTTYTMTNTTTGAVEATFPLPGALPSTFTVATLGFSVTLNSGTSTDGDSYIISPTKTGAKNISRNISNGEQIAAANPIRLSDGATNVGAGVFVSTTVNDINNAAFTTVSGQLSPPIRIEFTSPTTYNIVNNSSNVVIEAGLAFTPNSDNQVVPTGATDYGYSVTIGGAPETGDSFLIDYNNGGVGDNRNILSMAALQTTKTLQGGSASYLESYNQLVGKVGIQTLEADIDLRTSESLMNQALNKRESISGVNLDEEAANLIKFQQAYEASAQIINVANTLFQTLINTLR
jgi:flagellar hook-associated protein 1 FlgK